MLPRETLLLVLGFTVFVAMALAAAVAGWRRNSVAPSLTELLDPSLSEPKDQSSEDHVPKAALNPHASRWPAPSLVRRARGIVQQTRK